MIEPTTLRPAREDEAAALGALKLRASLAHGDHVLALMDMPEAGQVAPELLSQSIVAERGGLPVGFVSVLLAEKTLEIEELFVEPAYWRSGRGARLVEAAVAFAHRSGAATLRVVANKRAQAFYERCGFAVVGEVATELEAAPLMARSLAP